MGACGIETATGLGIPFEEDASMSVGDPLFFLAMLGVSLQEQVTDRISL